MNKTDIRNVFDNRLGSSAEGLAKTPFESTSTIFDIVKDLLVEYGKRYAKEIKEIAGQVFEDWVRPFDIPGIPNFVEKRVDDMLKQALLASIDALLEHLDDDSSPPEPEPEDEEDKVIDIDPEF